MEVIDKLSLEELQHRENKLKKWLYNSLGAKDWDERFEDLKKIGNEIRIKRDEEFNSRQIRISI